VLQAGARVSLVRVQRGRVELSGSYGLHGWGERQYFAVADFPPSTSGSLCGGVGEAEKCASVTDSVRRAALQLRGDGLGPPTLCARGADNERVFLGEPIALVHLGAQVVVPALAAH